MTLWPLGLYFVLVVGLVAGMTAVSHVLGQRHRDKATGEVYEGGIVPVGDARVRFSVRFYLVAMFFVIFDLEVVFIFAWAVAARELGWYGYATMAVFIGLLLVAFAYLWRLGAFDWAVIRRWRD